MKFAQLATVAVVLAASTSSVEAHKLSSNQRAQLQETLDQMEEMQTQMDAMDKEMQQLKFDFGSLFNKAKNFLGGLFH